MNEFRKVVRLLSLLVLVAAPGARAQDRVMAGAFDAAHANGIVLITNHQNIFGVRFLVYRQGASVEESPRQFDFGRAAVDGSAARIQWRTQFDEKTPVLLRWSRVAKNIVVGRLTAPASVRVAVETYRPWGQTSGETSWPAFSVQPDRQAILGEHVHNQKSPAPLRRLLLRFDRTGIGAANYNDLAAMRAMLVRDGHPQQIASPTDYAVSRLAALSFDLSQNQSVGFVAVVGDDFDAMGREAAKALQKPLDEILDNADRIYDGARPISSGAIGESLESVTRWLNWNRYYWAERQLEFIAPTRRQGLLSQGAVFSWDSFFAGAMAAMLDGGIAASTMHALLEGQTVDGRLPLRRHLPGQAQASQQESIVTAGRSMPPVGTFCVWRVYLATHDLELLAWAYPRLKQWNDWWTADRGDGLAWRDGNGDGLLEFGIDAEAEMGAVGSKSLNAAARLRLSFSETGLEDRPQWPHELRAEASGAASASASPSGGHPPPNDELKYNERTHTVEFSPVGLNSLYALDTETLAMMARELGLSAEAQQLQTRYERIRDGINKKLWSEEDGLYLNRYWDGRYSRRLSLENFYPLIAGLASEERAKILLEALRETRRFGFEQPLPFIARNDPAFDGTTAGRGGSWAPANYLLYLGLKRYGFHDEAAQVAARCSLAARTSLEKTRRLPDLFPSAESRATEDDAETARPPVSDFAGLALWPAIEELINSDPWGGLAMGSVVAAEESRIERLRFSGASFDVIAGPKRTVIRRDGKIDVECEGPVRLRAYRVNDRAIGFAIETREQVRLLVPGAEGKKITVSVDDKVLGSTSPGAAASFRVPPGAHKVLIVK
ncbi:MAG: trehalase family glycosidase [Blastocatellia bacterium]|nr:trehalase family glycosidase [Blastocatellia bacterium]